MVVMAIWLIKICLSHSLYKNGAQSLAKLIFANEWVRDSGQVMKFEDACAKNFHCSQIMSYLS